ncbi:uncharacterized protein [Nicotiana tomentosiformis]|uniref:uncharacterized protein n=1 Tax=Nicotiana tomentosiformis TaxID=4098 RepID=UPI00388C420B
MPPVDPIDNTIIEEQGEVHVADPTPVDFTSVPGFQDVMGRILRFMDNMTQAGLFLAYPATSKAGGGAQTPTAQARGQAAAVYQTQGALPVGGVQPVAAATPEPRPAVAADPQKLLDRWTRLHPPIFGGDRHEDPQDFIDHCKDRLYNMRILESRGVDFATFQLEGVDKDAILRSSSIEEDASASNPQDNKRKRASASEDPKSKMRIAQKPRTNTIPLTVESVLRLRDEDEEEEEENDRSVLVARMKKTIDASKAVESMVIYKAKPQTEEATIVHREACSRYRAELCRYEADLQRVMEESNALKLLLGQRGEEIKDLRAKLAKAHQDQTDLSEQGKSSVQARRIEELEARLASRLAKAKSDTERAKADADAFVAVYQVDAEATQVQAREAADIANTQAHWVAELANSLSRRETLEEIHARGFDLAEEIKKAKELEFDAEALAYDDADGDADDWSKSGSESGKEPDGEEISPVDNQVT